MKRGLIWIVVFLCTTIVAAAQPTGNNQVLAIGTKAPLFSGTNQFKQEVALHQLLEKGPVIVLFYRGYWCPFCNRQLKQLQDSIAQIRTYNAQVVAITPESAIYVNNTIDKTDARFHILSDVDNSIMNSYRVAYKVDATTESRLKNIGIDLNAVNASNDAVLPVPAVYIINKKGIITYAFFDTNYRHRPSVQTLAAALKRLQ